MQIFNTLTRQKEEFVPQVPGEYRIYVCGPTVYNYIHIGNARPLIVFDTLRRYLEYRGNKVIYVSNITDIDDKLIKKGQEEGTSMKEVAQRFEAEYLKDAAGLNCKKPTVQPRATEHIQQILDIVKDLIDSGAMSKECINWTQGDVMNQFISGNVAMMVNGCWQIPTMRSEAADLNWGVSLIPMCDDGEYASVIGGENYAVIEGGNVDGALDFLNYMTNEDVVVELMSGFGYIAGIESIAQNQFSGDEDYLKFVEQMTYAKARGPHEDWPSISDAISLAFNQVMTGSAAPADAAAEAQATVDSILK